MGNEEKEKKVIANAIIEVIGKPPEHLKKTLEDIIEKINKESSFNVKSKKINEAKELESKKGFYSNFAEIEIEFSDISKVPDFVFRYMPSHIDISYPENISLQNHGWNNILNELTRRLHQYDEVARTIKMEKRILEKKLKQLTGKESNNEKEEE